MNAKGKSTLGNFNKHLNLKGYSKNTIDIYCHYISEFIMSFDKSALHLTINDAKLYIEGYNFTSKSKQNQIYSSIKAFYKIILNIDLSGRLFLERPRKSKTLPKVIDKKYLLDAIYHIKNTKHQAIISLGYSVGLRVSEVINLKIDDIDSKRMIIHIRNAKGAKDRIVPLSQSILILLRKYYNEYKPFKYLFNGQNSLKYSAGSCNKIVKKYLGVNYHFHMLRHSSFTSMLEAGTDISIIQNIAGHSKTDTTRIYAKVSTLLLKNAILPI